MQNLGTFGTVFFSTIIITLGAATPASAQFISGWTGEVSLSGNKTTGNTDTSDVGLRLSVKKTSENWRHNFKARGDLGRARGSTNKRRYNLNYQLDREISERFYAFGSGSLFSDDFGPFQEGHFIGAGIGYEAFIDGPIKWRLESGPGYRSQQAKGPLGVRETELSARLGSEMDWALNDNVSIYNNSELTYSESDTFIWNDVGLTATLMGNLAARLSFRVEHHTDVPVRTVRTDTITRFGLVYKMK